MLILENTQKGETVEPFSIEEKKKTTSAGIKIAVVGVGGGGSNMVTSLAKSMDAQNIEFIVVNTDKQALDSITDEKIKKVQIGKIRTRGLG